MEFCNTLQKKTPPLLPRGLTPSSLARQAHDSMTMRAKFQQCLHSTGPTGPTGPDSLELPTVLSSSPHGHLARSHRYGMCAEEVSMWTALLLPGPLKSLHTARSHFSRLPWSGLPWSSLHTMHTLAGHASINMENAVGKPHSVSQHRHSADMI